MQPLKKLEETVASWPRISVHPHRFGGCEFRFANAEVGHVHYRGIVDIPFPRSIRDALLTEGLAEEHRWVPNSGWITFRVRNNKDLQNAVWLMRLSYFRYPLKAASGPPRAVRRGEPRTATNRSVQVSSRTIRNSNQEPGF